MHAITVHRQGLMPTSTPPTDWVSRWGGAIGGFQ